MAQEASEEGGTGSRQEEQVGPDGVKAGLSSQQSIELLKVLVQSGLGQEALNFSWQGKRGPAFLEGKAAMEGFRWG